MNQLLAAQYAGVKDARQALFAYCRTMDNDDLNKRIPTFNEHSILSLLTHVVNAYVHWVKFFDQGIAPYYFKEADVHNMDDADRLFEQVDTAILDFLLRHETDIELTITRKHPVREQIITTTPLLLYTTIYNGNHP